MGQLHGSKLINCRVDYCDVSGNIEVGGIVGDCSDEGSITVVENCYVNDSTINGSECVGAILGAAGKNSTISNCFACGDMSKNRAKLSSETDGLIGKIEGATVTSCYYWKNGYKQGTTTGWTDWDSNIWNVPSTIPCLPTLRVEQEQPSAEWYSKQPVYSPEEQGLKDESQK